MFNKFYALAFKALILTLAFSNEAKASTISNEFFPFSCIPKEYETLRTGNSDLNLIKIEGWSGKGLISVFETSLLSPKKHNPLKAEKGVAGLAVSSIGYVPGMPITMKFTDEKNKFSKEIKFIPSPLYVESVKDGAKIEAIFECLSPANYTIKFMGFDEREELSFQSICYNEKIENKFSFDKPLGFSIFPEVIGKKGGIAKIKFTRSSGEALELELSWGLEVLKYILYPDQNGNPQKIIENKKFLEENPEIRKFFEKR